MAEDNWGGCESQAKTGAVKGEGWRNIGIGLDPGSESGCICWKDNL